MHKCSNISTSLLTLVIFSVVNSCFHYFLVKVILMHVKWMWYLTVVLMFISLMITDVEHLFMYYWPFVYLL